MRRMLYQRWCTVDARQILCESLSLGPGGGRLHMDTYRMDIARTCSQGAPGRPTGALQCNALFASDVTQNRFLIPRPEPNQCRVCLLVHHGSVTGP